MERIQYQESLKIHRDLVNSFDYAEKRGEKRGEIKQLLFTIKNCHEAGFTIEQISVITKLTEEEIKVIIKEQGWSK